MEIPNKSENSKPKLKIKLLDTSLIYNRWKEVNIETINDGNTAAKDITFKFSDDISIRYLPEVEVKPKSKKTVEFYLKPNTLGEVPVEVEIKYKDNLNKEYKLVGKIIICVEEKICKELERIYKELEKIYMELEEINLRW